MANCVGKKFSVVCFMFGSLPNPLWFVFSLSVRLSVCDVIETCVMVLLRLIGGSEGEGEGAVSESE